MEPKDPAKVAAFLTRTRVATRNEIASGCDISRANVQSILNVVVSDGAVIRTGSEDNTATYALAGVSPVTEAMTAGPVKTSAEIWAENARRQGLADWKKNHPEEYPAPQKRYEPSDEEIAAEQATRAVTPLSAEESADLERRTRGRIPVNQQQFIK